MCHNVLEINKKNHNPRPEILGARAELSSYAEMLENRLTHSHDSEIIQR